MFTRLVILTTAAFAALAVATPTPSGSGSCNTGPVQCCNSVTSATDESTTKVLSLLGIVVKDVDALVGMNCSPVNVIGVGSNSCKAQPVCCTNNSRGGLISIGCVPVSL